MRPLPSIALGLMVFIAACDNGSAQLQGTWVGDRAEGIREDQQAQAAVFVSGLRLVFDRDTVSVTQDGKTNIGRYKLHHEDQTSVVIYSGEGEIEPQTFSFAGDRKLRWAMADGRSILLTKSSK